MLLVKEMGEHYERVGILPCRSIKQLVVTSGGWDFESPQSVDWLQDVPKERRKIRLG
jgi:hypothetical protein